MLVLEVLVGLVLMTVVAVVMEVLVVFFVSLRTSICILYLYR